MLLTISPHCPDLTVRVKSSFLGHRPVLILRLSCKSCAISVQGAAGDVSVFSCHGLHNIHSSPAGILLPWVAAARSFRMNMCQQPSHAHGEEGRNEERHVAIILSSKNMFEMPSSYPRALHFSPEEGWPYSRGNHCWSKTVVINTNWDNLVLKLYGEFSAFPPETMKTVLPQKKEIYHFYGNPDHVLAQSRLL